ncbi:MAG: PIN domain-containing protein [Steroidobacteraceae bacterium]
MEQWLTEVVRSFAERVMPIDQAVADEWGRISAKRSLSTINALLAATAKVNGMTLATRNISDVVNLGVRVLDPFERQA